MGKKKVSFRVPPKLWQGIGLQIDSLALLRGQFLNGVIAQEVQHLKEELRGRVLSTKAKRYISGLLKKTDPESVNLVFDEQTIDLMNQVISESNLVRDAFFCRVLIFLRSSDALLNHLGIPLDLDEKWFARELPGQLVWPTTLPTSPIKAMMAVQNDPFFYIREFLADEDLGIYTLPLPAAVNWAACFLEEIDVPGSKENIAFLKEIDAFEAIETSVFASKTLKNTGDPS